MTFGATGSFEETAVASSDLKSMVGSVLLCSVSVEGEITTEGSKPAGNTGSSIPLSGEFLADRDLQ